MKLKFTRSAEAEYLAVIDYIRQRNPKAANDFRRQTGQTFGRLETFPNSGRTLPEFPHLEYREVIVQPYRFFYRVADDSTVLVVAVWHSAQLPQLPEDESG